MGFANVRAGTRFCILPVPALTSVAFHSESSERRSTISGSNMAGISFRQVPLEYMKIPSWPPPYAADVILHLRVPSIGGNPEYPDTYNITYAVRSGATSGATSASAGSKLALQLVPGHRVSFLLGVRVRARRLPVRPRLRSRRMFRFCVVCV